MLTTHKYKLGATIRSLLKRVSNERMYSSRKPDPSCKPTITSCEPPEPDPKVFECVPDCEPKRGLTKTHPILPIRGCLPWEKGGRVCPAHKRESRVSTPCPHDCQPYPGQEFIDRTKVSTCEFRRFQKCYAETGDGEKCLGLGPNLGWTKKIYPLTHAILKGYLPGCPVSDWQRIQSNNETDCNFIF